MVNVLTVSAFKDNYIWIIKDAQSQHCIIVDPGDTEPVLKIIKSQNLIVDAILITHKHYDHTDGVKGILSALGDDIKIYSKNMLFPQCIKVQSGENIAFFEDRFSVEVKEVPGHTLDHVVYYNDNLLFCGDTLFSGGCGRVMEGTHKQMFDGLSWLSTLSGSTKVYCAHEYTESNLAFAHTIEPKNKALLNYIKEVAQKRQLGLATIPSTISLEKMVNPFLRCLDNELIIHLQNQLSMPLTAGLETFSALRAHKDNF